MNTPELLRMIVQDLQPTPGRLRLTLRITVSTLITLVVVMAFRLPAALIALYFVMVVSRDTPQQSLRWTATLAAAICSSLGLVCVVVTTTGNDPIARLLSVAVVTFVAGVLVFSAKNAAVGSIGGYLYCIFIASWENNTAPSLILNQSVLTAITLIIALLVSTLVEFVLHYREPLELLVEADKERLTALGALYQGLGEDLPPAELQERLKRCAQLSADGQMEMRRLSRAVQARHPVAASRLPFSAGYIALLSELLDISTAYARRHLVSQGQSHPMHLKISKDCALIAKGESIFPNSLNTPKELKQVLSLLQHMSGEKQRSEGCDRSFLILDAHEYAPFFRPGVWKDKAALVFGCKVSLCATFCYIFYHAVAWPAISSCVTTVLITALSATGPMKQRLLFRFIGVLLGGVVVGLGTIVLLFPNMNSIASLLFLVGAVVLASAWISAGRTLGYLGLQLGFCFYTVIFRGPSPETQVQSARDACVGIFIAIGVMWLVFDQLWPVRVTSVMRGRLLEMVRIVREFLGRTSGGQLAPMVLDDARVTRHRAGQTLVQIRMLNDMAQFELGLERGHIIRQAEVLQEIAVEVAVVVWHSLDFIYGQMDGMYLSADWREFHNDSSESLETIQLGLNSIGTEGFAKGRYPSARKEGDIAEELERLLPRLKNEAV